MTEEPSVEEIVADLASVVDQQAEQIRVLTEQVERLEGAVETVAQEAVTDDQVLEHVEAGVEEGTKNALAPTDSTEDSSAETAAADRMFQ